MTDDAHTPGSAPVSKKLKYRLVRRAFGDSHVAIDYDLDPHISVPLTSSPHRPLEDMLCGANRPNGGSFVVNEWCQIFVPRGDGTFAFVGHYTDLISFSYANTPISPEPPADLEPGERWPGPCIGRSYVIAASCDDIYYKRNVPSGDGENVRLSSIVGREPAMTLAQRLARFKGSSGGRFYVNERRHVFAPRTPFVEMVYLGSLGDDTWFPKPRFLFG